MEEPTRMVRTKSYLIKFEMTPARRQLLCHVLKKYPYWKKGRYYMTNTFLLLHTCACRREYFKKLLQAEHTKYIKTLLK